MNGRFKPSSSFLVSRSEMSLPCYALVFLFIRAASLLCSSLSCLVGVGRMIALLEKFK